MDRKRDNHGGPEVAESATPGRPLRMPQEATRRATIGSARLYLEVLWQNVDAQGRHGMRAGWSAHQDPLRHSKVALVVRNAGAGCELSQAFLDEYGPMIEEITRNREEGRESRFKEALATWGNRHHRPPPFPGRSPQVTFSDDEWDLEDVDG